MKIIIPLEVFKFCVQRTTLMTRIVFSSGSVCIVRKGQPFIFRLCYTFYAIRFDHLRFLNVFTLIKITLNHLNSRKSLY